MRRTVGLVIPAFRPNIDLLRAYVRDLEATVAPATIRIELDDPTPETLEQLEALPATVNAVETRRGKGAAITAGFCALETDVLAFVDADGATAVDSVEAVIDPVRDGRVDLSVGSRRHPAAEVVMSQSRLRGRMGDGFAWFARRVLDVSVSDYQCGAKAIDAVVWNDVRDHLCESGFAWDVELIMFTNALGYRIGEVPVTWADAPESTVSSISTPLELAGGLVRTHHRVRCLDGDRVRAWIAKRISEPQPLVDTLACTSGGGDKRSDEGAHDDE